MIEEIRKESIYGGGNRRDLIGLKDDIRPIVYDGGELEAGSTYYDADNKQYYIFVNGQWKEA